VVVVVDKAAQTLTWILDPIDGTKGFIRGEHFCVALGLAHDGRPVLGVLGCPNMPLKGKRDNGGKWVKGLCSLLLKGKGHSYYH